MTRCTFQQSCACDPCVAERLERDNRDAITMKIRCYPVEGVTLTKIPSSARADQPAPARATGECLGDRCVNSDPMHTAEECHG